MPLYYAKSTSGFYNSDFVKHTLPADAVEIDEATFRMLMSAQHAGTHSIDADETGKPILAPRKVTIIA
jgi:hypothetical protein